MATQRTSKEPDATAGEQPRKAAASTVEDTQRAIEEAYPKFAATLVEANLEAERQAGEALRRYLDAVRSAIELARKSEFLKQALGEDMHRTFVEIKHAEYLRVARTVNELDYHLYLHEV